MPIDRPLKIFTNPPSLRTVLHKTNPTHSWHTTNRRGRGGGGVIPKGPPTQSEPTPPMGYLQHEKKP